MAGSGRAGCWKLDKLFHLTAKTLRDTGKFKLTPIFRGNPTVGQKLIMDAGPIEVVDGAFSVASSLSDWEGNCVTTTCHFPSAHFSASGIYNSATGVLTGSYSWGDYQLEENMKLTQECAGGIQATVPAGVETITLSMQGQYEECGQTRVQNSKGVYVWTSGRTERSSDAWPQPPPAQIPQAVPCRRVTESLDNNIDATAITAPSPSTRRWPSSARGRHRH